VDEAERAEGPEAEGPNIRVVMLQQRCCLSGPRPAQLGALCDAGASMHHAARNSTLTCSDLEG